MWITLFGLVTTWTLLALILEVFLNYILAFAPIFAELTLVILWVALTQDYIKLAIIGEFGNSTDT